MNAAESLREHYLSVKPVMRGWLHVVAAPIAGTAAVLLAILAPSDLRIPVVLFALTTVLLFSVSAVYHRGRFSPRVTGILQRWDHANIFLVIAGSATPFAVALLGPGPARSLLAVLWLGAVGGALIRMLWVRAPRWLFVPMYLALGWASAMFLPGFLRSDILTDTRHAWVLGLILLGGIFYTVGIGAYAWRKLPHHHGIWHLFVLGGSLCHFIAILFYVR